LPELNSCTQSTVFKCPFGRLNPPHNGLRWQAVAHSLSVYGGGRYCEQLPSSWPAVLRYVTNAVPEVMVSSCRALDMQCCGKLYGSTGEKMATRARELGGHPRAGRLCYWIDACRDNNRRIHRQLLGSIGSFVQNSDSTRQTDAHKVPEASHGAPDCEGRLVVVGGKESTIPGLQSCNSNFRR
jgi:hypothetical protein